MNTPKVVELSSLIGPDGDSLVRFQIGTEAFTLEPPDARQLGVRIIEAATTAEFQSAAAKLMTGLQDSVDAGELPAPVEFAVLLTQAHADVRKRAQRGVN